MSEGKCDTRLFCYIICSSNVYGYYLYQETDGTNVCLTGGQVENVPNLLTQSVTASTTTP